MKWGWSNSYGHQIKVVELSFISLLPLYHPPSSPVGP